MAVPTNLVIFKYNHGDGRGALFVALFFGWLVLVAVTSLLLGPVGIFVFFVGIWLVIAKGPKPSLALGPRYLLCGKRIVYYANVRRMELTAGKTLTLKGGDGETFTLEVDRFPTNARKTAKVAANKAAKFEKVSNKLIRHVLLAAPYVECSGINRARIEQAQS